MGSQQSTEVASNNQQQTETAAVASGPPPTEEPEAELAGRRRQRHLAHILARCSNVEPHDVYTCAARGLAAYLQHSGHHDRQSLSDYVRTQPQNHVKRAWSRILKKTRTLPGFSRAAARYFKEKGRHQDVNDHLMAGAWVWGHDGSVGLDLDGLIFDHPTRPASRRHKIRSHRQPRSVRYSLHE